MSMPTGRDHLVASHFGQSSRHLGGWLRDLPDHRDRFFSAVTPDKPLPAMPVFVDHTPDCGPVIDQGQIGSCTACASTYAMTALGGILGRKPLSYSRLFVYYYTRKVLGVPATEDSGASLRATMKTLRAFGAALEEVWPYDSACFATPPTYTAIKNAKAHQILSYLRCKTLADIKLSLALGFTVVGGFRVSESMPSDRQVATTGDVAFPMPGEGFVGGHAIHVVGYSDNSRRFLFQNSWGTSWGREGFGTLPYEYVEAGLAEDFWTIRDEE